MGNDDVARTTALEKFLRVGEEGNHLHGARSLVDDSAHLGNHALMGIEGAVGQLQLHLGQLVEAVAALLHLQYVFLVHGEVDFHGGVVGDGRQHVGSAHQCSHLEGQCAYDTGGRALHEAEAQCLLGISQCCFGLSQRCLGLFVAVLRGLQFVVTNNFVVEQLL